MRTTTSTWWRRGAVALALMALAGCGSTSYGGGSAAATSSSTSGSSTATTAKADLKTADSGLGKVVVDGTGRTVYVFDKDTAGSGTSACTAACLAKWPPVQATSATPTGSGVTGKLGTITRDDGTEQVTLAGMPLYLYVGDSHPGDVTGQAVGGVWWAVSPSGTKITTAAASSSSAAYSGGY
jgi:predicted lipoprotein with Yx(FWY)xxD motif